MLPQLAEKALASTDFETNPISFTFDFKVGIMLNTTFVKVVCGATTCRATLAATSPRLYMQGVTGHSC